MLWINTRMKSRPNKCLQSSYVPLFSAPPGTGRMNSGDSGGVNGLRKFNASQEISHTVRQRDRHREITAPGIVIQRAVREMPSSATDSRRHPPPRRCLYINCRRHYRYHPDWRSTTTTAASTAAVSSRSTGLASRLHSRTELSAISSTAYDTIRDAILTCARKPTRVLQKTSLDLNDARDDGVLGWQWH